MNALTKKSLAEPKLPGADSVAPAFNLISLDQWQAFVETHPGSTPLHHRKWIELLIAHYGFKLLLPALSREGEIVAANAFLESRTMLGARKIISLPYTDCFTPLSYEDKLLHQLVNRFRTDGPSAGTMISIRTDRPIDGFEHCENWVRHRITLSPQMTKLLPRLAPQVRRNVKRGIAGGLTYQQRTDLQSVREFYRLHVLTRRKQGLPVQPWSFFQRLHRFLIESGLGFIGVVQSEAKCIAAGVFLQYQGTVLYKYGASDPRELSMRPNDFMFYSAIESAAFDCQHFDFGVTHCKDEGLCRFKRKWGAVEEKVYDVCVAGQLRQFAGDSPAVKAASTLIRHSPLFVSRALGAAFYRFGV